MKKLLKQLKPYSGLLLLIVVLTVIQVYSDLKLPDLMSRIVNNGIAKHDIAYVKHTGLVMLGWASLSMVMVVTVAFLASRVAMGFGRDLRSSVFRKVEGFSLTEFDKLGTSSLITRTTNDIQQVQQFFQILLTIAIAAPFTFVGAAYMAFTKDKELATVILVTIPILVGAIALVVRAGMPLLRSLQKKIDALNRVTREGLTGIRVIRAYNKTEFEAERFAGVNSDLSGTFVKMQRIMGLLMPTILIVVNIAAAMIIWFGAKQVDIGNTNVGNVIAILQYSMQTLFSIMMFSIIFVTLPRALASGDRISEVLEVVPTIVDPQNPVQKLDTKKGYLEFRDITFAHEGAESPTLCGITFKVNPGETTAIIGSTGSGKSSLVNLALRFYDPTSGQVLIDGVDIKDVPQEEVRSVIGYVPQKAFLFEGTIAENIRYGYEQATMEEVVHAAKIAQAHEFIMGLPDGYDAPVSQGGNNLSGGQKQRVAIARALVRKPEIYIFDDSFSALDYKTDAKLREVLQDEIRESANIIIGQRVASVMNADTIIVLDDGKIAGMGTHESLLKDNVIYNEIVSSQMSVEEGVA